MDMFETLMQSQYKKMKFVLDNAYLANTDPVGLAIKLDDMNVFITGKTDDCIIDSNGNTEVYKISFGLAQGSNIIIGKDTLVTIDRNKTNYSVIAICMCGVCYSNGEWRGNGDYSKRTLEMDFREFSEIVNVFRSYCDYYTRYY